MPTEVHLLDVKPFDFRLLDSPEFLEDSVREELVVPLLAALGYSASPPHRIIRSLHLKHPYVYIGSQKKHISIIPDYILQRDGENAWILDAKGPQEKIDSGKNVEQAFSYAIHKDVHVPIFALCNGRRLTVFHVSQWPAILDVSLQDLSQEEWLFMLNLLGTRATWSDGLRPGFHPDFGLALRRAGLDRDHDGKKMWQLFTSVPIQVISRIEDNLYSATGLYRQEYAEAQFSEMMLTFDFDSTAYQKLLPELPDEIRERIRKGLSRQPYHLRFEESEAPVVGVFAWPGDDVHKNENESYCPFIAEEFIAETEAVGDDLCQEAHADTAVTVISRVLVKMEANEDGWIGNAFDSDSIIASGGAPTEKEAVEMLRIRIEDYLSTRVATWLQEMSFAGSPDILSCPEGAIKLPIDIWVCKVAQQTCPIQAQVFVNDPEQFFAGCVLDDERKQSIFKAVSERQYGGVDHIGGRYLCPRCEDENGSESPVNYHYPWEFSSLEDFAPFVYERDMPEVIVTLSRARIPRSAVLNALCARHSVEIASLLYPEIGAKLRVLEFEMTFKAAPLTGGEQHDEG